MEFDSAYDKGFFEAGLQIIQQNGELLTLIRYPYMAGKRDFLIFRSEEELNDLLSKRKPRESIFFFKNFRVLVRGTAAPVLEEQITSTLISPENIEWILIFEQEHWSKTEWNSAKDVPEVFEMIKDEDGLQLTIIDEPNWLNDDLLHHAYVPDEDGIVRPGAY